MVIGQFSSNPSSLCSDNKSFLYKERFIYLFIGSLIFTDSCGNGIGTYRTTFECRNDSPKYLIVNSIQASLVNIEFVKCILGNLEVYSSITQYLCKIPYPLQ